MINFPNSIIFLGQAVLGWGLLYEVSYLVNSYKKVPICSLLNYLGQNTMPIVFWHGFTHIYKTTWKKVREIA